MSAKDASGTEPDTGRDDADAESGRPEEADTADTRAAERKNPRTQVQERRLAVKSEAVTLAAHLAGYGAKVRVGKATAQRATVEVRQETRQRYDVVVTVEEDGPVYTVLEGRTEEEFLDRDALRAAIIAPPPRWQKWWVLGLTVVLWGLAAMGVALIGKERDLFTRQQAYWVLPAVFLAGVLLTYALRSLIVRFRRASRMRRAAHSILSRG